MNNCVLQQVKIVDLIQKFVSRIKEGESYSCIGRGIGTIEAPDGRIYTVTVCISCDEDDFGYDDSLPLLDAEVLAAGECIISAPLGYLAVETLEDSQ